MTSHIYLALGMWDETVAANERTIQLINDGMRARTKDAPLLGCGHPVTWLSYAYLQQGRFADARRMLDGCSDEMQKNPAMPEHEMGAQSALDSDSSSAASFSVMRSRYLIDAGDWSGPVAAMKVNTSRTDHRGVHARLGGRLRCPPVWQARRCRRSGRRAKDSNKSYVAAATAAGLRRTDRRSAWRKSCNNNSMVCCC